jgi:hypothetical protein
MMHHFLPACGLSAYWQSINFILNLSRKVLPLSGIEKEVNRKEMRVNQSGAVYRGMR